MLTLWVALASGPAFGSGEAEEAEITFSLGRAAYMDGDFRTALANFLASNRLAPNPSVAFNIARCYAKIEKYAEAYRWFTVAAEGLSDRSVHTQVQDELREITPRVVVYELTSEPPGALVYADRKELGSIGTTPFKIAMSPSSENRTFIFEKPGWEDARIDGVRGGRGEVLPVTSTLKQIVGTVDIHAPEGTTVHQGAPEGPVVCEAPCEAKLAPGNWVLYFHKDGFRDSVRQLEVVAEQTITTLVELTPNTGSVVINASERGALVEIDGEAVGFTPTVLQAVAVGNRTVRVSRPGYQPVERAITVETDKQVTVDDIDLLPTDEVTAVSRRAERIELAPSSVTVISREELKAFQYPTIYEALRGVRGFALSYDSVYGNATVRGLGQANDYNNRLLLLQDGATLNDNILNQGFISYDGRVDLIGVERIEVVRGPGSVLYGTGAVSGVVNLVTDSIDSPEGTAVSIGAYDDHVLRGNALAHYKFGDRYGIRASVSGATSQGRTEIVDPRGKRDDLPIEQFDKFTGVTTTGRLWLGDATAQWYHSSRSQTIPTGDFFTRLGDPRGVWTDTRTTGELRYEPQLSEGVALLSRVYLNRYQYDGLLPYGPDADPYDSIEQYIGLSTGVEARVVAEAGEPFRLTVGGLFEHSPSLVLTGHDQTLQGEIIPQEDGAERYLDADTAASVAAGYALVDLVPVDAIRLTAGGRLDYWSATESLAISPRLALVLLPTDQDVVKLMGGRAFRAPSIYEVSYITPFQVEGPVLSPETVWSGELEYSHNFDDVWTGLVSGYASVAQNVVETVGAADVGIVADQPDALVYVNSDDTIRSIGADVELRRLFQGGWMVSTFYSLLDSRYASDGSVVPNAPRHSGGLKLIMPIAQPAARVGFRTSVESPRRIDLSDNDATPVAVVSDLVLSGTVPERGFDYAVGVYNLFNIDYAQPAGDAFPMRTMPQLGRSLMATISLRF